MSDDTPKPIYSPDWQMKLPAFGKEVSRAPKDWRKWEDGRGNKVDAPRHPGSQFTGKVIPPLVGKNGMPIKDGSLQVVRDAKGSYNIIDWSLPISRVSEAKAKVEAEAEALDDIGGGTAPIMGRLVYSTKHSLERALKALGILAEEARDRVRGLPKDPVLCRDFKDSPIVLRDKIWLGRFTRGKFKGHYVLVDDRLDITSPRHWFVFNKATRSLKDAVPKFIAEVKKRKVAPKKKQYVWPEIQFNAPEGFGGSGGAGRGDQTYPTPEFKSWDVIVDLYARTGRWCETAMLIWPDQQYPEELIEQCQNYRQEYLQNPAAFYDDLTAGAQEVSDDAREIAEGHAVVRDILEAFEGATLLSFKERGTI
jgi:hypothetical protein